MLGGITGDSDTIASIAGAIAEARFGIPEDIARQTWAYLGFEVQWNGKPG